MNEPEKREIRALELQIEMIQMTMERATTSAADGAAPWWDKKLLANYHARQRNRLKRAQARRAEIAELMRELNTLRAAAGLEAIATPPPPAPAAALPPALRGPEVTIKDLELRLETLQFSAAKVEDNNAVERRLRLPARSAKEATRYKQRDYGAKARAAKIRREAAALVREITARRTAERGEISRALLGDFAA